MPSPSARGRSSQWLSFPTSRSGRRWFPAHGVCLVATLLIAACSTPIGIDEVPTQKAYEQVEGNALSTGKPSGETRAILDRYQLVKLADKSPEEAVRQLHAKAAATRER